MTTSRRPFVARLAEPLPAAERPVIVRYDRERSVSQVLRADAWVDAVRTSAPLGRVTRKTGVDQETTDDD